MPANAGSSAADSSAAQAEYKTKPPARAETVPGSAPSTAKVAKSRTKHCARQSYAEAAMDLVKQPVHLLAEKIEATPPSDQTHDTLSGNKLPPHTANQKKSSVHQHLPQTTRPPDSTGGLEPFLADSSEMRIETPKSLPDQNQVSTEVFALTIPSGVHAGMSFRVVTPNGGQVKYGVQPGMGPGQQVLIGPRPSCQLYFNCSFCPFDIYGDPKEMPEVEQFFLSVVAPDGSKPTGPWDKSFHIRLAEERGAPFEKRVYFRDEWWPKTEFNLHHDGLQGEGYGCNPYSVPN